MVPAVVVLMRYDERHRICGTRTNEGGCLPNVGSRVQKAIASPSSHFCLRLDIRPAPATPHSQTRSPKKDIVLNLSPSLLIKPFLWKMIRRTSLFLLFVVLFAAFVDVTLASSWLFGSDKGSHPHFVTNLSEH